MSEQYLATKAAWRFEFFPSIDHYSSSSHVRADFWFHTFPTKPRLGTLSQLLDLSRAMQSSHLVIFLCSTLPWFGSPSLVFRQWETHWVAWRLQVCSQLESLWHWRRHRPARASLCGSPILHSYWREHRSRPPASRISSPFLEWSSSSCRWFLASPGSNPPMSLSAWLVLRFLCPFHPAVSRAASAFLAWLWRAGVKPFPALDR